jgi:two-component system KDP operon response regulator KdpE
MNMGTTNGRVEKLNSEKDPTILLGDDETAIRQVLYAQLSARGYLIYEASTGADVLHAVPVLRPDVILLDLGLPDIDGIEVTRHLRRWTQAPIIILSVRASETDKIAALDAGADNYLTKPYQPGDLFERIQTALLRTAIQGAGVLQDGDLAVDLTCQVVRIDNKQIQLTPTEYDLLKVFVLNVGRLLTQLRLAREVWGEKHDDEALRLLRTTIGTLRQKLKCNPLHPRHIITEPGVGYRLQTELQEY